ncbi:MAG: 2-C-methyl-D-erythritol 2,4-cyclodiphosphate synthase [Candidatus Moranbacteria bacterium]|nr:2-C-methyl-D-erythritol 2,4-cyclodiphosphate synthase [Candidatus Moranbacteria bacterium]
MFRVGIGQDSHRFSQDKFKKLVLGGFEINDEPGFDANSDGDVIIHSVCNALESAIGNKSFSVYADEMCKNGVTDSKKYLEIALEHIAEKGYGISNIAISLECKKPKILPIHENIVNSLASVLNIEAEKIGFTATTGEELTSFGKGLGVQSIAIVSLVKK